MFGTKYYINIDIQLGSFRNFLPTFRYLKVYSEIQISWLMGFVSITLGEYAR